jgi:uncharacterized protein YecE (DUF72 family)
MTGSVVHVRIGCAGWSIPKQFASRFPDGGTHLERYSRELPCAEINSSFYRSHRPQTWQRWAESVPDNFQFSVKAPKTITHDSLRCTRPQLKSFLQQLEPLGEKLGPILFQLPPSLEFDACRTKAFLALLRQLHAGGIVWEPRHKSWFKPCVEDLLTEFHVARVGADPCIIPEATRPSGWSGLVYFRLHGSPRRYYSGYDSDFLGSLATQMSHFSPSLAVWCIFDNTASGAATGNALELHRRVCHPALEQRRRRSK